MEFEFKAPTKGDINEILSWKFDGVYSFYDNDIDENKIEWIKGFVDSGNDFSVYLDDKLFGNCSFYNIEEFFCFGVQMKPDNTGKGFGTAFVSAVLEFGKKRYGLEYIDLTVAKFNERAIALYKKLGFEVIEEFVNTIRGNDYDFIAMRLTFDK